MFAGFHAFNETSKLDATMQRRIYLFSVILISFLILAVIFTFLAFSHREESIPEDDTASQDSISDQTNTNTPDSKADSSEEDTSENPPQVSDLVICIDPGHGYTDSGTGSDYLGEVYEKDIVLKLGIMVIEQLRADGYTVIATRENDIPPEGSDPLYRFNPMERVEAVENMNPKPDLFVSLHCNSYEADSSVYGSRMYYYEPSHPLTTDLAKNIADSVWEVLGEKEPLLKSMTSEEAYYVIRMQKIPCVLFEIGFVTNETEAKNMLDEEWLAKMASGIVLGIEKYCSDRETE